MRVINNKYFTKLIARHKGHIARLGRLEDPFNKKYHSFYDMVRIEGLELALYYADFKCEKCGSEEDLTRHHVVKRPNKILMDLAKYAAIRHYWFNSVILCLKDHVDEDGETEDERGVISKARIEQIKKKFSKEGGVKK